MPETSSGKLFRAGFFSTCESAERAIRNLLDAGFSKDHLAVICPEKFTCEFHPADVPRAERPGSKAATALVEGGAVGATLGGNALIASAIATGGVGVLPAIPVLIGGGAIAGGFSTLIAAEGYGEGVAELYEQAIHFGKIVVGVEIDGEDVEVQLEKAGRILLDAEAETLAP